MRHEYEGRRLRVYLGEADKAGGHCAFEAIVDAAREAGLAGATVLRGVLGYGCDRHVHRASVLRMSEDLPVVVEIVDDAAKIKAFLPTLEPLAPASLVTVETVRILSGKEG